MTKAQEIYERVHQLEAEGTSKAEAFKQVASEKKLKFDSVRGAFYSHKLKAEGGSRPSRTRRRETTPDDALASARASLERSIEDIDREVEAAAERAEEAKAEYEALLASAGDRKKVISERLESLK
jgi:predicted  nucleic acid-binding Zn-ribbon protein